MQLELIERFLWPATFRLGSFSLSDSSMLLWDKTIVTFADGIELFMGRMNNEFIIPVYKSTSEIMRIESSKMFCENNQTGVGQILRISSESREIGLIKTTGTRLFRGIFAGKKWLYHDDKIDYLRRVYSGKIVSKRLGVNVFPFNLCCRMKAERKIDSDIDDLLLLAVCIDLWYAKYADK